MTDFIPFPSPTGNSGKQIHPELFDVGQKIKVDVTAYVDPSVILSSPSIILNIAGQNVFTFDDEVNPAEALTDNLKITSNIQVDTRGCIGHPGRSQGPDSVNFPDDPTSGNKLTTKVTFPDPTVVGYDSAAGSEAHAKSAARGAVARVIARGYPENITLFFYGFGTCIHPDYGYIDRTSFINTMVKDDSDTPWDENDVNAFTETLSQPQLPPTYSIIRSDWSQDDDYRANPFAPRLYFHEDDALLDSYTFDGTTHQTTWRITAENYYGAGVTRVDNPSNPETLAADGVRNPSALGWYPGRHIVQNLGAAEIIDEATLNTKAHVTAYPTHTPWMENGITHAKRWVEYFITEWKSLMAELPNLKYPARILLNTDPGYSPSNATHPTEIIYGLMRKDARWNTEVVCGFGTNTMADIVAGTSSGDLNLSQDVTDFDGLQQSHRAASWDWSTDNDGCHNEIFSTSYSTIDGSSNPISMVLPCRTDGTWAMKNSNLPWWRANRWALPQIRDFRRYDLITFESWWSQILEIANATAVQRAVAYPVEEEFGKIPVSDYGYVSSSTREGLNAKFVQAFTGSDRNDINDRDVFKRMYFGGEYLSPVLYGAPPEEWNGETDEEQRRLDFYAYVIDSITSANSSDAVLLGSTISPYGSGENNLRFSNSVSNIVPWVKCPDEEGIPVDNTNLGDTKETVANMLTMLHSKGITDANGWASASVQPQRDNTEGESGNPTTNIFGAYTEAFGYREYLTSGSNITSFTPDPRPFLALTYANQRSHNFAWGMNNVNYRKTPATGADMSNVSTNGRVNIARQKLVRSQKAGGVDGGALNANLFARYMVHSPVGTTSSRDDQRAGGSGEALDGYTGGYQFGYSSDQMTMDGDSHHILVAIPPSPTTDTSPTIWYEYPNPYTDNGYPLSSSFIKDSGGLSDAAELARCQAVEGSYGYTGTTLGNQREAWAGAIDYVKSELSLPNAEFAAYLGYGLTYTDASRTTWFPTLGILYDRRDANIDNSGITADPPLDYDHAVWAQIAEATAEYGFERVWFDYGRPNVEDSIDTDALGSPYAISGRHNRTFDVDYGIKTGYESVPRESDGTQKADVHYTNAAYMVDFPENSTWDDGTEVWGSGVIKLDAFDFSTPSLTGKTEVHAWLSTNLFWDGGTIISSGVDRAWTWPMLKNFIDTMYAKEIIVSFDQATDSQISGTRTIAGNNKNITIQEVFQYVNELYANGSATDPDV